MPDFRIPKQAFFGQLASGCRLQGDPVRRYKDSLKINLRACDLAPSVLRTAPLDRSVWRQCCSNAISASQVASMTWGSVDLVYVCLCVVFVSVVGLWAPVISLSVCLSVCGLCLCGRSVGTCHQSVCMSVYVCLCVVFVVGLWAPAVSLSTGNTDSVRSTGNVAAMAPTLPSYDMAVAASSRRMQQQQPTITKTHLLSGGNTLVTLPQVTL